MLCYCLLVSAIKLSDLQQFYSLSYSQFLYIIISFFSLKENMMSYDRPWITWITFGAYCPFSIIHTFLAFSLLYHFLYFLIVS